MSKLVWLLGLVGLLYFTIGAIQALKHVFVFNACDDLGFIGNYKTVLADVEVEMTCLRSVSMYIAEDN